METKGLGEYYTGHWRRGKTLSEEHKKKIGEKHIGLKQSEESIRKRTQSRFLKRVEISKNISLSHIGLKQSKETIEKRVLKNTGKKRGAETKRKISLSLLGKCSKERRQQLSIAFKKRRTSPQCIEKLRLYWGSECCRKRSSENIKKQWATEEFRKRMRAYYDSDLCKRRGRIALIKQQINFRKKGYISAGEKQAEEILKSMGLRYIVQYPILNIEHSYPADFYLPDVNIVIEVDGTYWHNYPEGRLLDKIRTTELIAAGYKVIRFWSFEVNTMALELSKIIN